jgi:asparagine synthetase B (glutamine-hydrolysing)
MCGVFGVISERPIQPGLLEAAQAIQLRRGPDARSVRRLVIGRWHAGPSASAPGDHRSYDHRRLERMNGLWASAWIDLENSRIVIARDRFGPQLRLRACQENLSG